MPIYEKLKKLRLAKNLSQLAVADQLGISQNAYSLIESGKTKMDEDKIIHLSKVLDVHPFELFIDKEDNLNLITLRGYISDMQYEYVNESNKELVKYLQEQLTKKDQQIDKLIKRIEMLVLLLDLSHKSDLLPFAQKKFDILH